MNTFIKATGSEIFAVWRESNTVDGLSVLGQGVDAQAAFDVPQANRRIERGTGQYKVHVGIVRPRPGWTPLDCVNLFVVSLQVVNTSVLLH